MRARAPRAGAGPLLRPTLLWGGRRVLEAQRVEPPPRSRGESQQYRPNSARYLGCRRGCADYNVLPLVVLKGLWRGGLGCK